MEKLSKKPQWMRILDTPLRHYPWHPHSIRKREGAKGVKRLIETSSANNPAEVIREIHDESGSEKEVEGGLLRCMSPFY